MLKKSRVRKKLLLKLFKNLKQKTLLDNLPVSVKFRVSDTFLHKGNFSFCRSFYTDKYTKNVEQITITLDLKSLKNKVKTGYGNDYYTNRHEKLHFVIKNRKLALYFVLLHELRHAYQQIYKVNRSDTYTKEVDADNFAINYLKNEGLIKC